MGSGSWRECVKRKKKRISIPEFKAWECLEIRSRKKENKKKEGKEETRELVSWKRKHKRGQRR